jgi:hypothetical protein
MLPRHYYCVHNFVHHKNYSLWKNTFTFKGKRSNLIISHHAFSLSTEISAHIHVFEHSWPSTLMDPQLGIQPTVDIKHLKMLGMVTHTYNLRYLAGRNEEDHVSRPAWGKKVTRSQLNQQARCDGPCYMGGCR